MTTTTATPGHYGPPRQSIDALRRRLHERAEAALDDLLAFEYALRTIDPTEGTWGELVRRVRSDEVHDSPLVALLRCADELGDFHGYHFSDGA